MGSLIVVKSLGVYTEETLKDAYFPKRRGTRVTSYHKVGLVLENPSKEASSQEILLPMTGSHFCVYVCKPSLAVPVSTEKVLQRPATMR